MRLTDEQIRQVFWEGSAFPINDDLFRCVRKCLALAALPDKPKEYNERERRGFEVSQPGELPK